MYAWAWTLDVVVYHGHVPPLFGSRSVFTSPGVARLIFAFHVHGLSCPRDSICLTIAFVCGHNVRVPILVLVTFVCSHPALPFLWGIMGRALDCHPMKWGSSFEDRSFES
jgi:hypothetical protein